MPGWMVSSLTSSVFDCVSWQRVGSRIVGIRTHLAGSNSIVRSELRPCISKYSILTRTCSSATQFTLCIFFWEVRVHSPCPEKQPVWRFLQLLCLCIVGVTLRSPIRISNYPYTQPSSMCYFSESLTVGGIVLVWKCPQIQHEESMILGLVYYPLCNTILANRTVL